ncbi:PIN domain-containing protein [bacterium]|nr:PIN domain-containing protein [bacterium]
MMDTLLLDTNIVSYVMKGDTRAEKYRPYFAGRTLAISFMTVGELYEGAYRAGWSEPRLRRLREEIRRYLVIPFSFAVCVTWGQLRAERRKQPISVADGWIAATALAHACPLLLII